MPKIFDSFPNTAAAENFANEVTVRFNLRAEVFHGQDESERKRAEEMGLNAWPGVLDIYALSPPIVLVQRVRGGTLEEDVAIEDNVKRLAETFGGECVGT